MRFHVVGADKDTGSDVEIDVVASDRAEAEALATKRGLMVATVEPIRDPDPESIEFLTEDPKQQTKHGEKPAGPSEKSVAGKSVAPAAHAPTEAIDPSVAKAMKSGSMAGTPGASSAGTTGHASISGAIGGSTSQPGAHMEYHVIMNQSLYLLEVAVNKHLKDGWEPQGGIMVGISNNALQYFQAMIRHKD